MHLSNSMLANSAEIDDRGLLTVSGGVWEYVCPPDGFPVTVRGCFVGVVEFDADELGGGHEAWLVFHDSDGQDLGSSTLITIRSKRHRTPFVLPFDVAVPSPTVLMVEFCDEMGPMGRVECPIVASPPEV